MDYRSITSDIGKDIIRTHGDDLSPRAKDFILHYEGLSNSVSASRGKSYYEKLSEAYLEARVAHKDLVSAHLNYVVAQQIKGCEDINQSGTLVLLLIANLESKVSDFVQEANGKIL